MTDKNKTKSTNTIKAKKDFVIHHNKFHFEIKKDGEIDLNKIPKIFHQNLKTEGVI